MKVLDANFLIDYLDGVKATRDYYHANGGDSERWIIPVPAFAEVLVGEGNIPGGDVPSVRDDLAWAQPHPIDDQTAILAGEIAAQIGPQSPFLDGHDALIAAVGQELDAPVVSADSDLTHEATMRVVEVEAYR